MTFGRRRSLPRRLTALGAACVVQLWSLAPVAASVIYCIGEDGHSGFELVKAGSRGCADCCHEPEGGDVHIGDAPVSECTDIKIAPASGIASKVAPPKADVAFTAVSLPVAVVTVSREHETMRRRGGIDPPRGSPTRMLRLTVLQV